MRPDVPHIAGRDLLARFLRDNPTWRAHPQKRFAQAIGCSESHLSLILAGKRTPSLRLSKRIFDETGGLVPMASMVGEAAE